MKRAIVLLIIFMFLLLQAKVINQKKREKFAPVEPYLELVKKAILENDISKAVTILKKAKQCYGEHQEACGFVYGDYMQLAGLVYMDLKKYEKAENAFSEVLKEYPERTILFLYLGESLFHQKKFKEAAEALEKGYESGKTVPSFFVFKSEAEKRSGNVEKALRTLQNGLNLFNNNKALLKQTVLLYAENGFFKAAVQTHYKYLETSDYDTSLYLYLSDIFRGKGAMKKAGDLLEEAAIIKPSDRQILERLAYIYAETENSYSSALILKKLSLIKPKSAFDAAEQFRISGNFDEALRMNSAIFDPEKRIKEKFFIYLSEESYFSAFSLAEKLEKCCADDKSLVYKLAYSAVKSEQFDEAEKIVGELKNSQYKKAAEQLEKVIEQCRKEPYLCR